MKVAGKRWVPSSAKPAPSIADQALAGSPVAQPVRMLDPKSTITDTPEVPEHVAACAGAATPAAANPVIAHASA